MSLEEPQRYSSHNLHYNDVYTTWVYYLGILPGLTIKKVGGEARYKIIPNIARKRLFNFTMSPTADGPVSL